jgi:hypothetical protein
MGVITPGRDPSPHEHWTGDHGGLIAVKKRKIFAIEENETLSVRSFSSLPEEGGK